MDEAWRPVIYSTRYSISTLGRVRDNWEDLIVEPYLDDEGVLSIQLDGETAFRFSGSVLKLMSLCWFTGNLVGLEPYCEDGNEQNVALSNIGMLYDDPKTGTWRPVRTRERGGQSFVDRRMGQKVQVVETGEIYDNASEAAKAVGGDKQNVTAVLKGRLKSHRHHTFRYV